MSARLTRGLTVLLVETHLCVALAATGLTLFAQDFLGLPLGWYPAALVFASTMLIYQVDELFDRVGGSSAVCGGCGPWPGVVCVALYTGAVAFCLGEAPSAVRYLVLCGAVPCLLYGAPIAAFKGVRLRELPGVKPFFVTAALTVAAIGVPSLWTEPPPTFSGMMALLAVCLFGITLCNVTIFDLRDRDQDARYSIRTIPVILGVTGTRRFCVAVCAGLLLLLLMTSLQGSSSVLALGSGVVATALYCGALPANSGRLTYAMAVDGVPVLLGLSIL